MSNSMNNINLFNKNTIKFLKNLYNIIDNKNIKNQIINNINTIESLLFINNTILINKFKKDIYVFKNNIFEEDNRVIDYLDKLNFIPSVKVKHIWDNMNNYNKDICWKYLKTFIILCE